MKHSLIALAMIGLLSAVLSGCTNQETYPAMPEGIAAAQSDELVTVTKFENLDSWSDENNYYYEFMPNGVTPTKGFIIYPGGLVDPRGYAPIARAVAEAGYMVTLLGMPLDLAVAGRNRGDAIVDRYPEINTWAVGGHSVGGTASCAFARRNKALDGVVLWASYPSFSFTIAPTNMQAISIWGTNDGLTDPSLIDGSEDHLPPDTVFVEITGGNHTQFGYYGDGEELQDGDNPADISREAQQAIIQEETIWFMDQLFDKVR